VTAVSSAILECAHLGKRYGAVHALTDVSATVTGRVVGLLGPNGAGKSTLLKCLLGLIPFDGEARALGLSARTHGDEIRARVGYMPEGEIVLPDMTAVELCTYAAELSGLPRAEAIQRAHAALYYAGLEDKRYQRVQEYSTGMKQRVKLAQALVHDPELLFLDEPTNGLDPRARDEMLALITDLPERRHCTIILSTHLLPDVERVCDHAVIMHRGQVHFVGTVEELRRTRGMDGEYRVEVRERASDLAAALSAAGMPAEATSLVALTVSLTEGATVEHVFRTAHTHQLQVRGIEVRRESLETAFLRIIEASSASSASSARAQP
jgi:ABC-2 type transport system ATP-binding protein